MKIINVRTGEINERELTEQERAERADIWSAEVERVKSANDEEAAKEAARQSALAKLAALGLTEDEIAAITGAQ